MKTLNIPITLIIMTIISQLLTAQQNPCQPVCPVRPLDTTIMVAIPPPPPPISYSDCDQNGIPDVDEGSGDIDNDGILNICDIDNDGDGVIDQNDNCYSTPGTLPNGCQNVSDDVKKIFYVHGLKGGITSWEKVRAWSDLTYTKAEFPGVNYGDSQEGFDVAAEALEDIVTAETNNPISDPTWKDKQNYIIAHSLGGLVSRYLHTYMNNVDNPVPYNGIVTFSTPHQGAQAAASKVENGGKLYKDLIDDACQSLASGPIFDLVETKTVTDLFSGFINIDELIQDKCPKLASAVLGFAEIALSAPIEAALVPSNASQWPAAITTHNIAFYGTETETKETLFPRFAGAYIKAPNSYGIWGADDSDEEGIKTFNEHLSYYNHNYEYYTDLGLNPPWWCDFSLWFQLNNNCNQGENFQKAIRFQQGVNWFARINNSYKAIIGALGAETNASWTCTVWADGNPNPAYSYTVNDQADCTCPWSLGYTTLELISTNTTYFDKPSDAFVLVESSSNFPGAKYDAEPMVGSNHIQMRNDTNAEYVLKFRLFGGGVDPFFKID